MFIIKNELLLLINVVKLKGGLNFMSNCLMPHLLGYSCNLYSGFEDQLKTLNAHEIWVDSLN